MDISFIVGGTNLNYDTTAVRYCIFSKCRPDGQLSAFTTLTSLPEEGNRHPMVSYGNYLYVMGGFDNSYDLKNTVYYTETNTSGGISPWQSANNLAQPVFRTLFYMLQWDYYHIGRIC